jgi:hypothetical protein
MEGTFKERRLGSGFNDLSQIHDCNAMTHMLDDAEVMGDEEIRVTVASLKFLDEVEDLCLDRNIESRRRLIKDDELWARDQCPGNSNALPLAATEFMWVTIHMLFIESHFSEARSDPCDDLLTFGKTVDLKGTPYGLLDQHPRIKGRLGILKDDLEVSSHLSQILSPDLGDIHAVVKNLASIRLEKVQKEKADRGLPTTGLSNESQRFSLIDRQGDGIDRFQVFHLASEKTPVNGKILDEIDRFNDGFHSSQPRASP